MPIDDNLTVPTYPNYDLGRKVGSPCDTITSTKEIFSPPKLIKVFPNPARDFLYVNYEIPDNQNAVFKIYDSMGNEVGKYNLFGSMKTLMIHLEKYSAGMYYYSMQISNHENVNGKFCKM